MIDLLNNITKHMDYKEFIDNSAAESIGDGLWNVYANGIYKITDCVGESEFEAKEDAWKYIKILKEKLGEKD
jgi:hypothetical protein